MFKRFVISAFIALFSIPALADIDHSKDEAWSAIVNDHKRLSASQNGDKLIQEYHCVPSESACADAVHYNDAGVHRYDQVWSELDGKVFRRLICQMSESEQVRYCVDFDTNVKQIMMLENHEWKYVEDESI